MPRPKKSKSSELKKYENVYNKLLKEQQKFPKMSPKMSPKTSPKISPKTQSNKVNQDTDLIKKSPRRSPKTQSNKANKDTDLVKKSQQEYPKIKKLNSYQLFVQQESVKSKYKGLEPKERMYLIGMEWKKIKN